MVSNDWERGIGSGNTYNQTQNKGITDDDNGEDYIPYGLVDKIGGGGGDLIVYCDALLRS
jgi:hypothetical protein